MNRLDWIRRQLEEGRKIDLVSETELEILKDEYGDRLKSRPSTANVVRSPGGTYWTAELNEGDDDAEQAERGPDRDAGGGVARQGPPASER